MAKWDRMGNVSALTRKTAEEIVTQAAKAGHTIRVVHGKDSNRGNTEHYSGYATDYMTFSDSRLSGTNRAIGDWVAEYVWKHRKRLRVRWIIWRQRIRSTSPGKSGQWEGMANRGSPTANHMDHVHLYQAAGTYVPPSGSKPKPSKPKPKPSKPKPSKPAGKGIVTVKRGDTLSKIAAAASTSVKALVLLNGIKDPNRIAAGQRLYTRWVVSKGQTLSYIAGRAGTTSTRLASLNGIKDPNKIKAGQLIRLP